MKGVLKIRREWIIPLVIAIIVVGALGYWGYDLYTDKRQLEIYVGNKYQQSFYELVEQIEQLHVLLGKSLVSTSPKQNILILTDVWSHANIAQAELTKLPLAAQTVYKTAKFLAQTGDFAHVQAQKNAEGEELSAEDRETLIRLRENAIEIVETLQRVEQQVLAGKVNWVELVQKTRAKLGGDENVDYFGGSFDDIREEMNNVPQLIYDGPFSDHIPERKPQDLKGEKITKEEAQEKAREMVDIQNKTTLTVSDGTSVNGKIPSYNFQIEGDNLHYSVDISRQGGYLVDMLANRSVANSRVSLEEAVDKARNYLAVKGYPNMEETYSEVKDNIAYISFAYQNDQVIYYPDIINVQVALDNAQILAVEALNYLMSHHQRDPGKPKISEEEAKEKVSLTLDEVENVQLAVIPKPDLKEVLTYEVRGRVGEEVYLIFINAQTGVEERILKVILGERGTFAL